MFTEPKPFITKAQYLASERETSVRSEYHKGEVFAMAGASRDHNRILTNVSTTLDIQLKNRDCNNYSSDMKISVQQGERYLYPDIVVTCGQERFENDHTDVLLNPLVIVEILSQSTEAYDRGTKFLYYQTINALQAYVLISQTSRRLEIYHKQAKEGWQYLSLDETTSTLAIPSINCTLDFADVYFKVNHSETTTESGINPTK